MWLSWLSVILQGEKVADSIPVRAHALIGSVRGQGVYEQQPINVSFLLSSVPSLKVNKIFFKKIQFSTCCYKIEENAPVMSFLNSL